MFQRFDRPHWLRQRDGSRSRLQPQNLHRSGGSILGKIVFDTPHAARRLRPGGQSPAAGLPLHGFEPLDSVDQKSGRFMFDPRSAFASRWIALKLASRVVTQP